MAKLSLRCLQVFTKPTASEPDTVRHNSVASEESLLAFLSHSSTPVLTFSYTHLLQAVEAYLVNARFYSPHTDLSQEEAKRIITIVVQEVVTLATSDHCILSDACLLVHFLLEFSRHCPSLSLHTLISSLEPLFTRQILTSMTLSPLQASLLQFLHSLLNTQDKVASLCLTIDSVPEWLVRLAFQEGSEYLLQRVQALTILTYAFRQLLQDPQPTALVETLIHLIQPHTSSLLAALTVSPVEQSALLELLHSIMIPEFLQSLQNQALEQNLTLQVLRCSLFDSSSILQLLARSLLVLLTYHHPPTIALLRRCFPREFHHTLDSSSHSGLFEALDVQNSLTGPTSSLDLLFAWHTVRSLSLPSDGPDFVTFYTLALSDSHSYCLVWNDTQRNELQSALDAEVQLWSEANSECIWNSYQFRVDYPSYDTGYLLNDYFLRQIAEIPVVVYCSTMESRLPKELQGPEASIPILELRDPALFFTALYARLLTAESTELMCLLLRCLRVVYSRYVTICGEFFDMSHILQMLVTQEASSQRDLTLLFFQTLLLCPANVNQILKQAECTVSLLLQLLISSHSLSPPPGILSTEERSLVVLDIIYCLMVQSVPQDLQQHRALFPAPIILGNLATSHALLAIVNSLFLPSTRIAGYAMSLVLEIQRIVPQSFTALLNTPFIDALLLRPEPWQLLHVFFLRLALQRKDLLQGVLPDALLNALRSADPSRFITLFVGEEMSPRLIWTSSMRTRLLASIRRHILPYCNELHANPASEYIFTPLAHIHYPELDGEVFCGKHFLRQWTSQDSSMELQAKDPRILLQALSREWLHEGKRRKCELSEKRCLEILHLSEEEFHQGGDEICERQLWSLWNSDQEESEDQQTERQHRLQLACDLLTGAVLRADEPVKWRLLLIVRTQYLLYANHPIRFQSFPYPSFDLLVTQLQVLIQADSYDDESMELLEALTSLMLVTTQCGVENAECFVKARGLTVLRNLLLWIDSRVRIGDESVFSVLQQSISLLAYLAQFHSLTSILIDQQDITSLISFYPSLSLPLPILSSILQYLTSLAGSTEFRATLMHTPINLLLTILPLLFRFDAEEEDNRERALNEQCLRFGPALRQASSRTSSVSDLSLASDLPAMTLPPSTSTSWETEEVVAEATPLQDSLVLLDDALSWNQICRQVVCLLATLMNSTDLSPSLLATLITHLLTKSLSDLLTRPNSDQLLRILTSESYESPFIIWNESMRNQLLTFLSQELHMALEGSLSFTHDAMEFVYDAIKDELLIADVYVRVYNKQQPVQFLKDAKYFDGLLYFLQQQRIGTKKDGVFTSFYETKLPPEYIKMMLQSLELLLTNNPTLADEVRSIDDMLVLLGFLQPHIIDSVPQWDLADVSVGQACEVLLMLTSHPRICNMLVQQGAYDIIIQANLQDLPHRRDILFLLLKNISLNATSMQATLVASNLWLIFLRTLFLSPSDSVRKQRSVSIEVLATWCRTEEVKSRCRVMLRAFLPGYLVDALADPTVDFLRLLDGTTVTAEVIWDGYMRTVASEAIEKEYQKYVQLFAQGEIYELSDQTVVYEQLQREWCVGGVFVNIYLSESSYRLRKPREFLDTAMEEFFSRSGNQLNPTGSAIPNTAEEETKQRTALRQLTLAICTELRWEDPSLIEYFLQKEDLQRVCELWRRCQREGKLNWPVSWHCCQLVSTVGDEMIDDT